MSDPAEVAAAPITPQHYQVLCGLALGVVLLVNLQQGIVLAGLLAVLVGGVSIVLKRHMTPILTLLPIAAGQVFVYYGPFGIRPRFGLDGPGQLLQVEDVLLCAATLAYVAGHYRLNAIWHHVLPLDRRRRYRPDTPLVVPAEEVGKPVPPRRSAGLLTSAELAWFVLQLPLFALAGQGLWLLLTPRINLAGMPVRWMQFLLVAWALSVGLFVVGQLFRYWRRAGMDRMTARLLLQDALWHETRGEQRRVSRWLAWARLRRLEKEEAGGKSRQPG